MLSNMFWLKTVLFETSDSFCGMACTILVRPKPLGRPPIISPGCLRLESSIRFPIRFPMIFLFLDLDQASFCGFFWQSGSHKRDQNVWLYSHSINDPWDVLNPRPGFSFLWSHRRRFHSSGWLCLKHDFTKKRGEIRSKVLSKQELELALAIKRPQILQSLMN